MDDKEIKRILLGKLRGRNIIMHKDGLNQNLIILDDEKRFIGMKQMRYGTKRPLVVRISIVSM